MSEDADANVSLQPTREQLTTWLVDAEAHIERLEILLGVTLKSSSAGYRRRGLREAMDADKDKGLAFNGKPTEPLAGGL